MILVRSCSLLLVLLTQVDNGLTFQWPCISLDWIGNLWHDLERNCLHKLAQWLGFDVDLVAVGNELLLWWAGAATCADCAAWTYSLVNGEYHRQLNSACLSSMLFQNKRHASSVRHHSFSVETCPATLLTLLTDNKPMFCWIKLRSGSTSCISCPAGPGSLCYAKGNLSLEKVGITNTEHGG